MTATPSLELAAVDAGSAAKTRGARAAAAAPAANAVVLRNARRLDRVDASGMRILRRRREEMNRARPASKTTWVRDATITPLGAPILRVSGGRTSATTR